ncbi:hypothetical protein P7L78_22490 [Tistrella bauzanensis]|uniref:hypothetical protein n=1 Tax=Tistrella TaxID=171436 RepID=UPI0031F71682
MDLDRNIAYLAIFILNCGFLSIAIVHPYWLSDEGNVFFRNFVNHEILAFLGFVVTISLASSYNLLVELDKYENDRRDRFFKTRLSLKRTCYTLIIILGVSLFLVAIKSLANFELIIFGFKISSSIAFNIIAANIMFVALNCVLDMTRSAFRIWSEPLTPEIKSNTNSIIIPLMDGEECIKHLFGTKIKNFDDKRVSELIRLAPYDKKIKYSLEFMGIIVENKDDETCILIADGHHIIDNIFVETCWDQTWIFAARTIEGVDYFSAERNFGNKKYMYVKIGIIHLSKI